MSAAVGFPETFRPLTCLSHFNKQQWNLKTYTPVGVKRRLQTGSKMQTEGKMQTAEQE